MSSIEKAMERMGPEGVRRDAMPAHETTLSNTAQDEPEANGTINKGKLGKTKTTHHVDVARFDRQGLLTPESARSALAEEYRLIKRPVLLNAFGKGAAPVDSGNLVMITSALPGEGKTFTSINLAMSLAMELDTTVLMVDSDVVKPSLTRQIGLSEYPGLIDVLLDPSMDLSEVIVETDIPRLRVLPAGRSHSHSTELLASKQMAQLMREVSARYSDRIVILDAPPLLATSEASVLADLVGQILLVVEAGKTPENAIVDAIGKLNSEKRVIGTILNKMVRTVGSDYYGGYYGSYGH